MSIIISGYQITETLNKGERTVIYRGIRETDKQPVILKVLKEAYPSPRSIAWFKREFQILKRLEDLTHVINVYDFITYQNRIVITLEDIQGQSLAQLLKLRPIRMTEFFPIAIAVVDTLGQIHQRGIIHKDINPANVIYNALTGQTKIIDFGISTNLSREKTAMTVSKELRGTLAYISPEQTGRMNRIVDYRTDYYSLGAMFYELLTEALPFLTQDAMELVHSHLARQPQPLRERKLSVPLVLSNIVLKLMAKNAEDRYQSTFGLKADLEESQQRWQASGRVDNFEIAKKDVASRFQLPQKLYGREREITTLLGAFERVCKGSTEMMLIAGYSGIGKTALVQEIHRPMTRERGYFISGKFDQLQRDVPYASLTQAFQSLIQQLMTESEEQIAAWKEELLQALGDNGQVVINVIPELENIIGPQPTVAELGPMESQNRFNLTFQNFIQVFTQPKHPLILFIDDLQWTDTASLKLLQQLVTGLRNQALFIIGAYRDNEVNKTHPLMLTLAQIKEEGGIVDTLTLTALDVSVVNQIVADAVHAPLKEAQPLTQLVYTKTQGNPFFFSEFLKSLYGENLLTFDVQQGQWHWDLAEITQRDITDNVIDLMAKKVQRLESVTQEMLKLAACIGNSFDLQTLAQAAQKTEREVATDLYQALIEGLVIPIDEEYKVAQVDLQDLGRLDDLSVEYRFAHDRVQQAVYSLISNEDKQIVHLKIGRLLFDSIPADKQDQRIFDIIKHLNLGCALFETQAEYDQLAELNLRASQRAKNSAAFQEAFDYAHTSTKLLGEVTWKRNYQTTLNIYLQKAETAYLSGNFAQMEQTVETVWQQAKTALDKIPAYLVKMDAHSAKGEGLESLKKGLEALALLGVNFELYPTDEEASQDIQHILDKLGDKPIASLIDLPTLEDPKILAILSIIAKMMSSAYLFSQLLLRRVVCKMVELSIDYGNVPASATGYVYYGGFLCNVVNDVKTGNQFGELAIKIVERFGADYLRSIVGLNYYGNIKHRQDLIKNCLDPLLAGHQVGIDNGDFFYGNLALLYKVIYAYWISQELRSLEKEMAQDLQIMQQFKQLIPLEITETCYHMVLNLINPVEKPYELSKAGYDEAVVLDRFIQMKNQTALFILYTNKGVLAYLFNELESALQYFNLAEEHIVSVPGFLVAPNFHFYDALTRLALYVQASEAERQTHLEKVQADQDALQKWNEFAPQNYQHKVRLIEAVHAQVFGQESVVRELYDDAIILAQEGEYLCEEALASELAAQFYVQKKRKHVARHYMRDAVYAYLRWGALAKVQQLEKQYPDLLAQTASSAMLQSTTTMSTMMTMSTRTSHGIVALDFMTVLKASQMLAGEIKLDRLMINLMQVVIENAGAERGLLLLQKQGQWVIEAEGEVGKEEITVLQSIPIQNLLPLSIINYVTNTRQSVVLNDAMNEEEFAQDNYVRKCQPKSVLCIPLLNQGKLQGILYLENNLTTGAFTPDRIEILNLLSTQAAISIENASLYGHQVALTDSYGRFVPIDYLKFLHKERIMDVNLGDHVAKEMAVMFSDIRSFTSISETMSPQENFNFVNAYLKRVSPPIRINNGLIVKYIGDGIMAIFPNGADDAIRAGIGKLKQIEQYNIERQQEDRRPIKIGVGIHVGHMMVGMVGEVARMQGDAFSDNVNLTSRLEGLTKFYGTSLIVSEETLSNLENPSCYQMRYLDRVIVKGRSKPITIFEVLDGEPEQIMNFKLETQAYFEKGMRRYQARDFTEALFHFNEVLSVYPDDKAAILYLERATRFAREGVPSDWEGITVMTEK